MAEPEHAGPALAVQAATCAPGSAADQWQIGWHLRNRGDLPLQVTETWLPHGRFRGEPRLLPMPVELAPGETKLLQTSVSWHEVTGTTVENAFLILRTTWRGRPWRVLARLLVIADANGAPRSRTEAITVQAVGFSRGGLDGCPSPGPDSQQGSRG